MRGTGTPAEKRQKQKSATEPRDFFTHHEHDFTNALSRMKVACRRSATPHIGAPSHYQQ